MSGAVLSTTVCSASPTPRQPTSGAPIELSSSPLPPISPNIEHLILTYLTYYFSAGDLLDKICPRKMSFKARVVPEGNPRVVRKNSTILKRIGENFFYHGSVVFWWIQWIIAEYFLGSGTILLSFIGTGCAIFTLCIWYVLAKMIFKWNGPLESACKPTVPAATVAATAAELWVLSIRWR